MAHYDHGQAPVVYPPPVTAFPPPGQVYPPTSQSYPPPHPVEGYPQGPYVAPPPPPPPMGYPTKNGPGYAQHVAPGETQSRGDGFWKGCFAALCCCCVLDMCF